MRTRTRLFVAFLWAAALPLAAQTPRASTITPGLLTLDSPAELTSALGISAASLEECLCGTECGLRTGTSEDCRLAVGGYGIEEDPFSTGFGTGGTTPSELTLRVVSVAPSTRGGTVTVEPTALALTFSEPLTTRCGSFSYEVALAAGLQPQSQIAFLDGGRGDTVGLFVGTLRLAAVIQLAEVGGGHAAHLPLTLAYDTAGRFTVLPAGSMPPTWTNLALFTDREDNEWQTRSGCSRDRSPCGRLCWAARPETLEALNGLGESLRK
jgi:hypothetical protein